MRDLSPCLDFLIERPLIQDKWDKLGILHQPKKNRNANFTRQNNIRALNVCFHIGKATLYTARLLKFPAHKPNLTLVKIQMLFTNHGISFNKRGLCVPNGTEHSNFGHSTADCQLPKLDIYRWDTAVQNILKRDYLEVECCVSSAFNFKRPLYYFGMVSARRASTALCTSRTGNWTRASAVLRTKHVWETLMTYKILLSMFKKSGMTWPIHRLGHSKSACLQSFLQSIWMFSGRTLISNQSQPFL